MSSIRQISTCMSSFVIIIVDKVSKEFDRVSKLKLFVNVELETIQRSCEDRIVQRCKRSMSRIGYSAIRFYAVTTCTTPTDDADCYAIWNNKE